ncbi:outer membrane beta-barrel protein [Sphingobacterium sp. Mn56C]|uniref:outer membrane beta-barrel protein n=1 Tax=Sphingobacterium sp. Mn56C TaxID=3395261 RepID=UPI003BBC8740
MKTVKIAFFIAFVFNTLRVYAQQHTANDSLFLAYDVQQRTYWGLQAGLNYTSLYGKDISSLFADAKSPYKPAAQVGLFMENVLYKNWRLRHELNLIYNRAGVHLKDEQDGIFKSRIARLEVEVLPVVAVYQFQRVQVQLGPYFRTLAAANILRQDGNGSVYRDKDIYGTADNNETTALYLQKFDFGAQAAVQVNIAKNYALAFKYSRGFTDIFQHANSLTEGSPFPQKVYIFNHSWQIAIAYSL